MLRNDQIYNSSTDNIEEQQYQNLYKNENTLKSKEILQEEQKNNEQEIKEKKENQNNNTQNINNNIINEIHRTNQNHKTPLSKYTINPNDIPRPNNNDEIYLNNEKNSIFKTDFKTLPPHSTSHYLIKETENSSCRFLRPTLNYIPNDNSLLENTNLLFGICVQPFAEILENENKIPIVKCNEYIFRCKKCYSYINNKYKISYNKQNKKIIICNICNNENTFDLLVQGVKEEYLNTEKFTSIPELNNPTIDFIAPEEFQLGKFDFKPHYIFMIDIEKNSYELGLPSYILYSIQINLENFNNSDETYIAIALYDRNFIYFFYCEKTDIRICIMSELENPFCPISKSKLFLNIKQQREEIEKLFEKINLFIENKNKVKEKENKKEEEDKKEDEEIKEDNKEEEKGEDNKEEDNKEEEKKEEEKKEEVKKEEEKKEEEKKTDINPEKEISTPTGSVIKSGIDSLLENGGRVLIFTPNPCYHGYGSTIPREKIIKDKKNPFYPQNKIYFDLAEKANDNRITVDQFIFMCKEYDLSTLSIVSNLSGGYIEYYNYTEDNNILNSLFEKMHYDLTRIISRSNFNDCKFMIRLSEGVNCFEILGPFNNKIAEGFQIGFCDPDYCFYYSLRIHDTLKVGSKIHVQIACLYNDNFNMRYLRIFNSTYEVSDNVEKIYSYCDVDALTKAILLREISISYKNGFSDVRKNLEDRIINSFKYYRVKEKKNTSAGQLILPFSINYLPLYINSFIKKDILKKIDFNDKSCLDEINKIIALRFKFMRIPIYSIVKFLYPKFYRIDNILNYDEMTVSKNSLIDNIGLLNEEYGIIQKPYLLPLSKDNIDFDSAYLIDNGEFITLFIFNEIDNKFYNSIFGVNTFDEILENEINSLNEENDDELNRRILNIISQLRKENFGSYQPIRLFFFNNEDIKNPQLTNLLIEDEVNNECNYSDYLTQIYKKIQYKII